MNMTNEIKIQGTIPADAYVMIIGAMKCGTTSLFNYLSAHPQICLSKYKEPEFFSERQRHGTDVTHYEDLWKFDPTKHRYALEASTGYTKYPSEGGVPGRIHASGIRPKFVYVVRNPFERIESNLYHVMRKQPGNRGIGAELKDTPFLNNSRYACQLEQFEEFFPRSSILVIDFDMFIQQPTTVLDTIYKFLGLPQGFYPENFELFNNSKTKKGALGLYLKESGLLRFFNEKNRKRVIRLADKISPALPKQRLTVEQRDQVFDLLKDDMEKLRDRYGIDVSKWGF